MSDTTDSPKPAPAAATALAQALARKRALQAEHANGPAGRRQTERVAAAHAASKSKPKLRK